MRLEELTKLELELVRRSVIESCANYDWEYGCLLMDTDCYMLGIAYRKSPLCRYYQEAVLPVRKDALGIFSRECETKQGEEHDLSEREENRRDRH